MDKQEMLDKLKTSRSWKELGYSIKEVYDAFSNDRNETKTASNNEKDEEVKMLKEKVERLSETNKQLRAENKALKGKR